MKLLKILFFILIAAAVFSLFSRLSWATPSASFLYVEKDLGNGLWEYDYTLFNTSDPILDAGSDIYDVAIDFDPAVTFTLLSLPAGWSEIDYPGSGFVDSFSLKLGPPPSGTDVPPGTSLTGFNYQFDSQVGNLPFEATFTNPHDSTNPFVFPVPVPEPGTLILLGSGLAGVGFFRRKRLFKLGTN